MSAKPLIYDDGHTRIVHARSPEQRIRDGLVALADYLTDRDDYDIPHAVIAALCPDDVPALLRESCFEDLLRVVVKRNPDRTDLPWEGQVDLNEMTGGAQQ